MKLAILDDYQKVALASADWSKVREKAEIAVFDRAFADGEDAARALRPFDILCIMRERTIVDRALIERLPNAKLIVLTGARSQSLDAKAATERGIVISHTRGGPVAEATSEIAWGLILAVARDFGGGDRAVRQGRWQNGVRNGVILSGKRLGLLGLGKLGSRVAGFGKAFGMEVVAWSPNLTAERAAEGGARLVSKDELFATSDAISIHLVLSERTRGVVGRADLARMKPTAFLVNTSRGPLVDEAPLIEALRAKRIAGAGLDVFDREPLPADHPFATLENVLLTPHLGYYTGEVLRVFHGDSVENVIAWMAGSPIRVLNPDVLAK